ncbi:uncharacterized protein LOC142224788 [Haematobia irritans]|uniref:uncharacterized protein LOC142224788 n=1 Tax=Haematobia irritans TaxID=7368 RepID=UPI003F4FE32C
MREYFDIESCMVKLDAKPVISKDDEMTLKILESTNQKFENTYQYALSRFQQIKRKFRRKKLKWNIAKIEHLLEKNYARRLTPKEEMCITSKTLFLPHFAVPNPNKDSIRLVFDAASKIQGVSLNDFLMSGPDLNQPLLVVRGNKFEFRTPESKNKNITSGNTEKILGMEWSPTTDDFVFNCQFQHVSLDILQNRRNPTKREVLSIIMSVYDPFGLLCDFTTSGKIFMQNLWRIGVGWDEDIPKAMCDKWTIWLRGLSKVRDYKIKRCYSLTPNIIKRPLHIFCDASEMAMAAVAYWRIESGSRTEVVFVAGKTKCSPSKGMTIPRLELQAAVMAVRLKNTIEEFHGRSSGEVVLWTDSSAVLCWIRSYHRRYKQFVANRINEILESMSEEQWRWVPGELNTADEATRPVNDYNPNGRWKNGSTFLHRSEALWPTQTAPQIDINLYNELRKDHFAFCYFGGSIHCH